METKDIVSKGIIVEYLGGSRAYGTHNEFSDTDMRGIFCALPENIRTPFFRLEQYIPDKDTAYYELCNYMKLAVDCNPNIIEGLWVDEGDIDRSNEVYWYMRKHNYKLLSSKVAFTTSGYALAQLKRIKGHNKWLNNPQEEQAPKQIDYIAVVHNFTAERLYKCDLSIYSEGYRLAPFGNDIYGLYKAEGYCSHNPDFSLNTMYEGDTHLLGTPLFLLKFNRQVYIEARTKWKQYWDWKRDRNKDRSELEEVYGYDTKHAMHLVRLLRMGYEALTEGVIKVKRPDVKELLEIRNGAWKYEDLVKYAEDMDNKIRGELYQKTSLPKKPDIKFASKLLIELQDVMWEKMEAYSSNKSSTKSSAS